MARMTNRQIAAAFAAGATEGISAHGTIFIDGDTIYSYGRHWPIARRTGERSAIYNGGSFSRTTRKQTSYVIGAMAIAGIELTRVSPFPN